MSAYSPDIPDPLTPSPPRELAEPEYTVSIVVPVYNAGQRVVRCLDSLIKQSTDESFEIICVDDGSTDDTLETLVAFATQHPSVHVVQQKNEGIAGARNTGIGLARGAYIMLIDNDDVLAPTMLAETIAASRREDADIVSTGRWEITEETGTRQDFVGTTEVIIEGPMGSRLTEFDGYAWGMLIKRDMFRDIQFPQGFWYEDMLTRLLLYRMSTKFVYLPRALYGKYVHSDNASTTVWAGKSTRTLDQVNLLQQMAAKGEALGLTWDEGSYLAFLYEVGPMLHSRTRRLSRRLRRAAFVAGCSTVRDSPNQIPSDLMTRGGAAFARSVEAQDFLLWELSGWYWVVAAESGLTEPIR